MPSHQFRLFLDPTKRACRKSVIETNNKRIYCIMKTLEEVCLTDSVLFKTKRKRNGESEVEKCSEFLRFEELKGHKDPEEEPGVDEDGVVGVDAPWRAVLRNRTVINVVDVTEPSTQLNR